MNNAARKNQGNRRSTGFGSLLGACLVMAAVFAAMAACGGEPPPEISATTKSLIINAIEERQWVQDAAIHQDGKEITLTVVIDYAASETYAKEIGEDFVRLVMSFGPDDSPASGSGSKVGRGIYDYKIGIANPSVEIIVDGYKSAGGETIFW